MNIICEEKSVSVISTYNDDSLCIYKPQFLFSPASRKLNGSKYSAFIISICQVVKLNTLKNKQRCNIIQFRGLQGGYVNIISRKMAPPNCKSSLLTLNITSATAYVMPGELSLSQKKEKLFDGVKTQNNFNLLFFSGSHYIPGDSI